MTSLFIFCQMCHRKDVLFAVRSEQVLGSYQSSTYDAGHGQGLLQVAQKHFSLVEHLRGLVLRFLGMNEDGSEEESHPVLHPQLLYPAAQSGELCQQLYNTDITPDST